MHMHTTTRKSIKKTGAQHCESGRNKSIGCSPTHGDVGELFPGECGRPVANNPPHPRKHGRRRRGPQMSDKKGRCCRCNGGKMRRFCFSLLTPQNQGEKKNKETLGRKQSVALRGVLLPLVLPQRSMKRRGKRGKKERESPGPCDRESMRARHGPQAEGTRVCCMINLAEGRRTATGLPH